ncbi:hypothetical protein UPYG_G00048560 [Umbra pygmaea]|uniref:Uncharacterized protein n=1 Tax=Umbra pygmaea TaxID=75934 RepID=A0ABD0XRB0_UMBPY
MLFLFGNTGLAFRGLFEDLGVQCALTGDDITVLPALGSVVSVTRLSPLTAYGVISELREEKPSKRSSGFNRK